MLQLSLLVKIDFNLIKEVLKWRKNLLIIFLINTLLKNNQIEK